MRGETRFVVGVLLALSICLPGGAVQALAAEGGTLAGDEAAAEVPQNPADEVGDLDPLAPVGTPADQAADQAASAEESASADEPAAPGDAGEETATGELAAGTLDDDIAEVAAADAPDPADGEASGSAAADFAAAEALQARAPAADGAALQRMVDEAPDGGTVTITADMEVDATVTIPAGKTLTLTDDGTPRTLNGTAEPMFSVEGTLVIAATADENLVLQGIATGAKGQGAVATVTGTLDLRSGTLKGGAPSGVREGTVVVSGGTFDMSGGVVTGEQKNSTGYVSTVTIVVGDSGGMGSTFNLSGGVITDNHPASGWAVLLMSSTMNMTGGSIDNNDGGVIATFKSTVNLSGGEITNNAFSGFRMNSGTSLNMTGGLISGNHGAKFGGGIYAQNTDGLNIQGGSIIGNTSGLLGGGIYVNSDVKSSSIDNALVTGNTATLMGGGVWCCPTSKANVNVTDGMAIFDNSADGAGDDFANLDLPSNTDAQVTVSARMLGGGLNALYVDGAISYNADGTNIWEGYVVDGSAPRYDAANPGGQVIVDGSKVTRVLKSDPSEEAKQAARTLATTIISGNVAKAGGGIATNGSFTSGSVDDEWELAVSKAWDGEIPEAERTPVPVFVVVNGVPLDHVLLGPDNGWSASFTGLPNPGSVQSVEVLEGTLGEDGSATPVEPTDRWLVSYSGIDIDVDSKHMEATVTNAPLPETVSVSVEKAWDDAGDRDGLRPSSVSVQLLADGAPVGDPVTIDADGGWAHTWEGLLKYGDDGHEVAYSVEEVAVPEGYAPEVTGDMAAGFTVTNAHVPAPETVSVPVSKVWVGGQGGPVKVRLLADGSDTGKSVTLDEASGWGGSFDGLPKLADDGRAIAYTVAEDVPAGYASEVTGDMAAGFVVTNTLVPGPAPETVSVPVSKVWVGGQGGPVKVRLLADGSDTGKSVTLDEASGWRGSFDGLPRLGGDGKAIAYTVAEDVPAGYSSEVTGDADSGFTVTNTRTPDVPGSSSHDGDRPIPKTGDRTGGPLAPMAAAAVFLALGTVLLVRRARG